MGRLGETMGVLRGGRGPAGYREYIFLWHRFGHYPDRQTQTRDV